MRGSRVATHVVQKVPAASSSSSSPATSSAKRGRQEGASELQQQEERFGRQDEDDLIAAERTWFTKGIREGLTRARAVLKVIKNDVLDGDDEFERLAQLSSLEGLMNALPGIPGQVFRAWFTFEEWQELELSEAYIASESYGRLRTLRLKRQKQLLDASCKVAIDLTVRDAEEVEEQSTLVQGCTTAVQVFLDRVGMNARGTMKRVVKMRSPLTDIEAEKETASTLSVSAKTAAAAEKKKLRGSRKRATEKDHVENVADRNGNDSVVATKEKQRRQASKADCLEEEQEEDGDGDDGVDRVATAVQPRKEKEEAREHDENDREEEVTFESLLERAQEDVAKVTQMLQEARKGAGTATLVLQVGSVNAPDSKLACEIAGKVLWEDEGKLKRCLDLAQRDNVLDVENWGVLLKWWRVVERAFSITGLFAHLRGMRRRGKKALPDRYALVLQRLKNKNEGKVLSFKQAEKYDRLGRFLLQFPSFVFQIHLVSLADWHQKIGDKVLMDSLESILDEEQLQFWRNPVPPTVVDNREEGEGLSIIAAAGEEVPLAVNVRSLREDVSGLDPNGVLRSPRANSSYGLMLDNVEADGMVRSISIGPSIFLSSELPTVRDEEQEEEEEDDVEEECRECGTKGKVVFLKCDGPGRRHSLCWKCNGYSSPPLDELSYPGASSDFSIRTYVFCANHLNLECCTRPFNQYLKRHGGGEGLLKISDFVNHVQAEEARQIVRIFSDPACQFSIVRIEPNGWCMFVSVARALGLDWTVLAKEMKAFAAQYLKNGEHTVAMDDPQEIRRLWRQLDPRKASSVQPFWTSEAGDFLIPMMAAHLNARDQKAVQIRVWMIENGTLEMTKLVYPDGRTEEFRVVVNLLKSNAVVEHYDLLKVA